MSDSAACAALLQKLRTWNQGAAPPGPPSPFHQAILRARRAAASQQSLGPMADPVYRIYYEAMLLQLKQQYPGRLYSEDSGYVYGTAHLITQRHMKALQRKGPCRARHCIRSRHPAGEEHMDAAGRRWR